MFREFFDNGHIFQLSTRLPFSTHPFSIPDFMDRIQRVQNNKEKVCDKFRSLGQSLDSSSERGPTSGHLGQRKGAKKGVKMQRKFSAGVISISPLTTHLNESDGNHGFVSFKFHIVVQLHICVCKLHSNALWCLHHYALL